MKVKIMSACTVPGVGLLQTGQVIEVKKNDKKIFTSLVNAGIALEIKEPKKTTNKKSKTKE